MTTTTTSVTPTKELGRLVDANGNNFTPPDFTINQIRAAVPKHCFERSGLRGLEYVARDLALLSTTFYVFNTYNTAEFVQSKAIRFCLWALYGFLQGLSATGLWVIAHECGHQAFSTSKILNDTTGWILHSALLVPYFSWKISHGKHHKSTGHMDRDMVFIPKAKTRFFADAAIHGKKLPVWQTTLRYGRCRT